MWATGAGVVPVVPGSTTRDRDRSEPLKRAEEKKKAGGEIRTAGGECDAVTDAAWFCTLRADEMAFWSDDWSGADDGFGGMR